MAIKWLPMESAPENKDVLLKFDDGVIEGRYTHPSWAKKGQWELVGFPSHGCGCCASENPEPKSWAEL